MTFKMLAKNDNRFVLFIFILKILVSVTHQAGAFSSAMDDNLYKQVINASTCEEQMEYILTSGTILRAQFMDASIRVPRGILKGNLRDMGNYYQCLEISEQHLEMFVEGKYCVIQIPVNQDIGILELSPRFPWPEEHWPNVYGKESNILDKDASYIIKSKEGKNYNLMNTVGALKTNARNTPQSDSQFELALCIPKVCTTQKALEILTNNASALIEIREAFCRLPNDKPWVAADYVAICIFSVLGLLTILCTAYDIRRIIVLKKDSDPKPANKLYTSFSAYTNCKKFFTFNNNPKALNCLDGIRSIAMLWVIIGHTFSTQLFFATANPLDTIDFITSFSSIWLTSATITVDTFLMIGGLLLVYSTAPKLTKWSLLKNLHLFYLNRILRMFPVLATAVLLQASLLNHVSDGPNWEIISITVTNCQTNWWSTLLYVQNYVSFGAPCLGHSWYLAIDMQLYIISPLVLFWILGGNKRTAWIALLGSFLIVLISSTVYNFIMEFQSGSLAWIRPEELDYYTQYYYINTLTRAAPFFVGMIFGYILHLCRGKNIRIPKEQVILLWLLAFSTTTIVFISHYFPLQLDWDNQTVDSILNSFMRPAWAAGVAWLVFACSHGYAGPIDWFLSLHIFKILSRLSYAMFILHLPIVYITNSTILAPLYFSVEFSIQKFMIDLNFTLITSFLVTTLIDLPFSTLIGMLMGFTKYRKNKTAPKIDEIKVVV